MRTALFALAFLIQASTTNLAGTWTLDTYLSDNPEQVLASIRADFGENRSEVRFPTMGRRGERRPTPPREAPTTSNADEQKTIDDVTTIVRYPPPTLTVAQTESTFTITDAQGRSRTFDTNGKREPQTFDAIHADSTASWQGPQLVISFDLGKGRTMRWTYAVVPTTHQLSWRIAFERAPNQPGPFEIRYVYNR